MNSDSYRPETEINLLRAELNKLRRENGELKQHVQESRNRFFDIFKAAPGLIAITRIDDGKILFINQDSADLHGHGYDKLIGSTTMEQGLWADPAQRARAVGRINSGRLA